MASAVAASTTWRNGYRMVTWAGTPAAAAGRGAADAGRPALRRPARRRRSRNEASPSAGHGRRRDVGTRVAGAGTGRDLAHVDRRRALAADDDGVDVVAAR